MSFVDDILKRLFPERNTQEVYRENFQPSSSEVEANTDWHHSAEGQSYFDLVHKNYQLKKGGVLADPAVHILQTPYANGLAVEFDKPFSEKTFSGLFFAFGQRVVDLGYQRLSLDRKIQEKADGVSIIEKQYFKPKTALSTSGGKIDQLYGNVTIEKELVNNRSQMLKILTTIYSDHLYLKARSFDEFIEVLFDRK